jgi:hypothetical protein
MAYGLCAAKLTVRRGNRKQGVALTTLNYLRIRCPSLRMTTKPELGS